MSRSRLRGLGLVSATLLAASLTLSTPASAEDATGNIAGTITDNGAPVAFALVDVRSADFSFSTNTFTITGKVTAAGPPIVSGVVGIVGPDLGSGSDIRYTTIAADGSYTVDYLGPYEWPLLFGAQNHAYQWSGGVGNRLKAALVLVKVGKTTKFNYRMKVGTDVAITYNLPAPNAGRFSVRNAVTGDIMAIGDIDVLPGTVHVLVIGPQTAKIGCDCNGEQWHGGTDFASATPVSIPATGSEQIIFVVP